jgi:hypothetical protein
VKEAAMIEVLEAGLRIAVENVFLFLEGKAEHVVAAP